MSPNDQAALDRAVERFAHVENITEADIHAALVGDRLDDPELVSATLRERLMPKND